MEAEGSRFEDLPAPGAPQPARPCAATGAFFIYGEVVALQRSGLDRDRLKISLHTAEDGESDRSNVVCILSPGSTQLVSKMGLLCKEADGAITRMLPLPFFLPFLLSVLGC